MTCTKIANMIVCTTPIFRLPLENGGRVFMEYHSYCGPVFYRDKQAKREIENWWEYAQICAAYDWFTNRGRIA